MRNFLSRSVDQNLKSDIVEPAHWHNAGSYPQWWIERSKLLLTLLLGTKLDGKVSSFSEYGCGPNKPFRQSLRLVKDARDCHLLDLKSWDAEVIAVNLDAESYAGFPQSDCGVLSGVIEYLRSPAATFSKLAALHSHLLVSYCYADIQSKGSKSAALAVQRLARRAALGWRNHLDLSEIVAAASAFGYVCQAVHWRDQVLILIARHDG
jgi:hypothetical protein